MSCEKMTLEDYKNLSTKTGVSGGINVNKSGSRNLTFYVNTTDKEICSSKSKGFSAGVEIKITPEKVQHALKSAYAYRDAYDAAKKAGNKLDTKRFSDWTKRFVYSPELDGKPTPFGEKINVVKKFPVTLLVTGSENITKSLGECLSLSIKGAVLKCISPHKNKGAIAQTLGETPLTFVIGDGCEVA